MVFRAALRDPCTRDCETYREAREKTRAEGRATSQEHSSRNPVQENNSAIVL